MNDFVLAPKSDSPGVIFKPKANEFKIYGKSLPEDAIEFYTPVLDYLSEYSQDPMPENHLQLNLEYYNSASVRILVNIVNIFEQISKKGKQVKITWLYEETDEVMKESGLDFKDITSVPFELKSYKYNG